MTREQVAVFIGQWWHPLHYFPTFLARCVAVLPDIGSKSAVSKILNQETGEGNTKRAHEVVYIDTMERVGFTRAQATEAPPFPETVALVAGYERASEDRFGALGFIFATEVADLVMVSGIGTAVERVTGTRDLEWVNIHVEQEPDHVEEADHTMLRSFNASEESLVMDNAEEMWRLWTAFFDRLENEVFKSALATAEIEELGALSA
jgi:pyrroloquinoline quinone (PQQ) biosynthesis protein C